MLFQNIRYLSNQHAQEDEAIDGYHVNIHKLLVMPYRGTCTFFNICEQGRYQLCLRRGAKNQNFPTKKPSTTTATTTVVPI